MVLSKKSKSVRKIYIKYIHWQRCRNLTSNTIEILKVKTTIAQWPCCQRQAMKDLHNQKNWETWNRSCEITKPVKQKDNEKGKLKIASGISKTLSTGPVWTPVNYSQREKNLKALIWRNYFKVSTIIQKTIVYTK